MEEGMTYKQSEFIKSICSKLNLEFDLIGSTKQEANRFIKEHLNEYNKMPTDKQLNYIDNICRRLGVKFEGKTKQEAYDFIKKYEPKYLARGNEIYESLYRYDSRSDFEMEDYCGIPPWEVFSPYDI